MLDSAELTSGDEGDTFELTSDVVTVLWLARCGLPRVIPLPTSDLAFVVHPLW